MTRLQAKTTLAAVIIFMILAAIGFGPIFQFLRNFDDAAHYVFQLLP